MTFRFLKLTIDPVTLDLRDTEALIDGVDRLAIVGARGASEALRAGRLGGGVNGAHLGVVEADAIRYAVDAVIATGSASSQMRRLQRALAAEYGDPLAVEP